MPLKKEHQSKLITKRRYLAHYVVKGMVKCQMKT